MRELCLKRFLLATLGRRCLSANYNAGNRCEQATGLAAGLAAGPWAPLLGKCNDFTPQIRVGCESLAF
jgi:hypothetical protein